MSMDLNLQDGREKVYINEKMYGKDRDKANMVEFLKKKI